MFELRSTEIQHGDDIHGQFNIYTYKYVYSVSYKANTRNAGIPTGNQVANRLVSAYS